MAVEDEGRKPIPAGKFRAVEENVKSRKETHLGDFDSFEAAEDHIGDTFRSRGEGWFTYAIYNGAGKRIFIATTTKRKVKVFGVIPAMKVTYVSESG